MHRASAGSCRLLEFQGRTPFPTTRTLQQAVFAVSGGVSRGFRGHLRPNFPVSLSLVGIWQAAKTSRVFRSLFKLANWWSLQGVAFGAVPLVWGRKSYAAG
jgi:hypothetical protein